jgi:hypothetical protein
MSNRRDDRGTSQRLRGFLLVLPFLCCLAALLGAQSLTPASASLAPASAKERATLESFYIVTQANFLADPKWVDHILDVHPQGSDVLVREIRIAPLHPSCPRNVTVRAIERVLPSTSVRQMTFKFPLCSYAEDDVAGMISVARHPADSSSNDDDTANQTIVARCGDKQKMFELPDQESLRFEALTHADSHVAALWKLAATMESHAFGEDFSLAKVTGAPDQEAQALGAKLVPEIKSGKYDQGFADNSCPFAECRDHNAASALQGFAGPIFACPSNVAK